MTAFVSVLLHSYRWSTSIIMRLALPEVCIPQNKLKQEYSSSITSSHTTTKNLCEETSFPRFEGAHIYTTPATGIQSSSTSRVPSTRTQPSPKPAHANNLTVLKIWTNSILSITIGTMTSKQTLE